MQPFIQKPNNHGGWVVHDPFMFLWAKVSSFPLWAVNSHSFLTEKEWQLDISFKLSVLWSNCALILHYMPCQPQIILVYKKDFNLYATKKLKFCRLHSLFFLQDPYLKRTASKHPFECLFWCALNTHCTRVLRDTVGRRCSKDRDVGGKEIWCLWQSGKMGGQLVRENYWIQNGKSQKRDIPGFYVCVCVGGWSLVIHNTSVQFCRIRNWISLLVPVS